MELSIRCVFGWVCLLLLEVTERLAWLLCSSLNSKLSSMGLAVGFVLPFPLGGGCSSKASCAPLRIRSTSPLSLEGATDELQHSVESEMHGHNSMYTICEEGEWI